MHIRRKQKHRSIVSLAFQNLSAISILITAVVAFFQSRRISLEFAQSRTTSNVQCEGHVVLIRHGEKGSEPIHLSEAGFTRADYLARYFSEYRPPVARLYASDPRTPPYVQREVETLIPLSQKIKLPIISNFSKADSMQLAEDIFRNLKSLCGKSILISWDHCNIPRLARYLGCNASMCRECWSDHDFDSVFRLTYTCSLSGSDGGCEWTFFNVTRLHEGLEIGVGQLSDDEAVDLSSLATYQCSSQVSAFDKTMGLALCM